MADIRCFLLTPTGRTRRSLRRYTPSNRARCPGGFGYHNAKVLIVDGEAVGGHTDWAKNDPRWPTTCQGCSYLFVPTDEWNLFTEHEYRRGDTGDLTTLAEAPLGAMWWATWLAGHWESPKHVARGGGPHLIVKTPGGEWDIDQPSSNANGEGWDRTGTAPDVVARPSIQMGPPSNWHGYLGGSSGDRPGWLVAC